MEEDKEEHLSPNLSPPVKSIKSVNNNKRNRKSSRNNGNGNNENLLLQVGDRVQVFRGRQGTVVEILCRGDFKVKFDYNDRPLFLDYATIDDDGCEFDRVDEEDFILIGQKKITLGVRVELIPLTGKIKFKGHEKYCIEFDYFDKPRWVSALDVEPPLPGNPSVNDHVLIIRSASNAKLTGKRGQVKFVDETDCLVELDDDGGKALFKVTDVKRI